MMLQLFKTKPGIVCACAAGLFISIFLFTSCASGDKGVDKKSGQDSAYKILTLPSPGPLSQADSLQIANKCQSFYDTILKPRGFNGGIVVAKNGHIVFERYTGTGHIPGNDPITDTTAFHVASVSKTFTAMAVLKLAEEGKLNIDDELSKYFPKFNYPGVTIRNLLSHRSGIPTYDHFMAAMGWDPNQWMTNLDLFSWITVNKSLMLDVGTPNTRFTYSNTNYALLAILVQVVSGKTYPEYLKYTFFGPLQMNHTFVFEPKDTLRVIPSYDWRGRIFPFGYMDGIVGDKNIYTTCRDLLIWDRALKSGLLFKEGTLKEAYAPYSNEKPGIKNYGLGWHMNIFPNGKKIIFHNGLWHGNNAVFMRLLDEDATIILTGSKTTRAVYAAKQLANIFGQYDIPEEEEEGEQTTRQADSLKMPQPLLPVTENPLFKKRLSKKDSLLQEMLKDQHREKMIQDAKKLN